MALVLAAHVSDSVLVSDVPASTTTQVIIVKAMYTDVRNKVRSWQCHTDDIEKSR